MADPASAADAGADAVVDDAQSAASGIRQAAKWIASALAAIPALGIVGNLIKGPGDAGFNAPLLFAGVIIAAAGAYLGIYLFSRVLTPIPLGDVDLAIFDMSHLPGQPFQSYVDLSVALAGSRDAYHRDWHAAEKAKVFSDSAGAEATATENFASQLEAALSNDTSNAVLKQRAADARKDADLRRALATERAGEAAAADEQATIWLSQLHGLEKIRTQAFQLQASTEVGSRFRQAQLWAIVATGLVAIGVSLLAISPKQKPEPAATSAVSLVTIHPNQAGKDALGCQLDTLYAIRTGGTDAAPEVITLPTGGCKAQRVTFTTQSPVPLGTVEQATPVPLPSPSASASASTSH